MCNLCDKFEWLGFDVLTVRRPQNFKMSHNAPSGPFSKIQRVIVESVIFPNPCVFDAPLQLLYLSLIKDLCSTKLDSCGLHTVGWCWFRNGILSRFD